MIGVGGRRCFCSFQRGQYRTLDLEELDRPREAYSLLNCAWIDCSRPLAFELCVLERDPRGGSDRRRTSRCLSVSSLTASRHWISLKASIKTVKFSALILSWSKSDSRREGERVALSDGLSRIRRGTSLPRKTCNRLRPLSLKRSWSLKSIERRWWSSIKRCSLLEEKTRWTRFAFVVLLLPLSNEGTERWVKFNQAECRPTKKPFAEARANDMTERHETDWGVSHWKRRGSDGIRMNYRS